MRIARQVVFWLEVSEWGGHCPPFEKRVEGRCPHYENFWITHLTADHTRVANGKRGQAQGPQAESSVRKVQAGPRASPLFPRL
jgi:hypothetical protein